MCNFKKFNICLATVVIEACRRRQEARRARHSRSTRRTRRRTQSTLKTRKRRRSSISLSKIILFFVVVAYYYICFESSDLACFMIVVCCVIAIRIVSEQRKRHSVLKQQPRKPKLKPLKRWMENCLIFFLSSFATFCRDNGSCRVRSRSGQCRFEEESVWTRTCKGARSTRNRHQRREEETTRTHKVRANARYNITL